MARLRWLPAALNDVERLTRFIDEANPTAARRAAERILRAADQLQAYPKIGRRLREDDDRRELIVPFGSAAYVLRYRIGAGDDVVVIRVWHSRELRR